MVHWVTDGSKSNSWVQNIRMVHGKLSGKVSSLHLYGSIQGEGGEVGGNPGERRHPSSVGRTWELELAWVPWNPYSISFIVLFKFQFSPSPATAQNLPLAARRRLVIFMSRSPYPWWPTWGLNISIFEKYFSLINLNSRPYSRAPARSTPSQAGLGRTWNSLYKPVKMSIQPASNTPSRNGLRAPGHHS